LRWRAMSSTMSGSSSTMAMSALMGFGPIIICRAPRKS
jgi:hypothetical protein